MNCIINTKRLALLPSGSAGVKILKVPGFTEGRCSGPSTPDFRTKKELSPCGGELFGAGALTPQIRRDPDQTARFTFNSDYVNMLVVSQTKHGTPRKLSAQRWPLLLFKWRLSISADGMAHVLNITSEGLFHLGTVFAPPRTGPVWCISAGQLRY